MTWWTRMILCHVKSARQRKDMISFIYGFLRSQTQSVKWWLSKASEWTSGEIHWNSMILQLCRIHKFKWYSAIVVTEPIILYSEGWRKPSLVLLAFHLRVPIWITAALLPMQAVNGSAWAPVTHEINTDITLSFSLEPSPVLAAVSICGVNQQMEVYVHLSAMYLLSYLFIYPSIYLSHCEFQRNKIFLKFCIISHLLLFFVSLCMYAYVCVYIYKE